VRRPKIVDRFSADDEAEWRTQVGWPIFQTAEAE
jgi:hypothetical protein